MSDGAVVACYPRGSNNTTASVALRNRDLQSFSASPGTLTPRIIQLHSAHMRFMHPELLVYGIHIMPPTDDIYAKTDADEPSTLFGHIAQDYKDWKYVVIPMQTLVDGDPGDQWNVVVLDRASQEVHLFETDPARFSANCKNLFLEKALSNFLYDCFQLQDWNFVLRPQRDQLSASQKDTIKGKSGIVACAVVRLVVARMAFEQASIVKPWSYVKLRLGRPQPSSLRSLTWAEVLQICQWEEQQLRELCADLQRAEVLGLREWLVYCCVGPVLVVLVIQWFVDGQRQQLHSTL